MRERRDGGLVRASVTRARGMSARGARDLGPDQVLGHPLPMPCFLNSFTTPRLRMYATCVSTEKLEARMSPS